MRVRYRDTAGEKHARHFRRRIDAERWLTSVENAKHRGEWIDPALSRITLGERAERWMTAQAHLKPHPRKRYRQILKVQILPRWSKVRLAPVTHARVAELWAAEYVVATIRQVHRGLA